MLRTPMFQRFAFFSADCVLGGSLGRTWGACGIPRASWWVLGTSLGLLGDPWGHLGGSLVGLGVSLEDSLGVLGGPWGVLVGDQVRQTLRTATFQRLVFLVALAYVFYVFFVFVVVFS